AVRAIARAAGVPVIEDAAQHGGATLRGSPAGALADTVILSFGRGKGTTSGNGGALLSRGDDTLATAVREAAAWLDRSAGARDLLVAAASWALGRPSLYTIPSAIPGLHLGETVYHEAGEPRRMSRAAVALLARTFPGMDAAVAARRRNGFVLRAAARQSRHVQAVQPIEGGEPGYLRFPLLMRGEMRTAPALGAVRGYPRPLSEEPELRPILSRTTEPLHGAREAADRLVTLPTHHLVRSRDLERLSRWMLQG
ncbi:MAG TPA: DegT/DnrJ/EryC1/StrS family aminotransferase, partial [Candidatus Elarobacter sp.]|nr:DegT/DnrJ/EryC1/StrS family aminotransferase [Candidatus Elarobacter sp.]